MERESDGYVGVSFDFYFLDLIFVFLNIVVKC